MSRFRWSLLAGAVALVAAVLLPAVALAAPQAGPSYLRLAHLSPDTPRVDVYLASVSDPTRNFSTPGVDYGSVSDYRSLPADTYTVSMLPAGAQPGTPPVIATTLTTTPGDAYTVAGTGLYAGLGLTVLDDELTMPQAGSARIRVVNAAATAPQVDLAITEGPAIADGVGFAETTGYRTVPVGSWTVEATVADGGATTRLPVDVDANAVYTVLLLDDGDRLAAELHLDSTGSAAVPLGGIETGLGGLAGSAAGPLAVATAMAGLVTLALLARLRRNRSA